MGGGATGASLSLPVATAAAAEPERIGEASRGSGLSRDDVAEVQRARLLVAITDAVCEQGPAALTVSAVVGRAGVSRRTFYELFQDIQACLLAALERSVDQAQAAVLMGYDPEGRWLDRVRSGLVGFLSFVDENPRAGRLLVVESLGAGPAALRRRGQLVARAVELVEEGRRENGGAIDVGRVTAEGVVGGALSVVHVHMVDGRPEPAISLAGALTSMIVMPYLGVTAARRELERKTARRVPPHSPPFAQDVFKGLETRLTYRTMRVLSAVDSHPGGSNREVGAAAGMSDQGQISKLLNRLRRGGLIASENPDAHAGVPNKWTLTRYGGEIQRALGEKNSTRPAGRD